MKGKKHMVIISNFQAPKDIKDLEDRFYNGNGYTSLELLLEDAFETGSTEWTVDRNCNIGDIVLFMCAKTAKDHIGHVCAQARKCGNEDLIRFAEEERQKYKIYSGCILGIGILIGKPFVSFSEYEYQGWKSPWYGKISDLVIFDFLINIDEFRDFIKISRTGSITKLTEEQWECLKELILEKGNKLSI